MLRSRPGGEPRARTAAQQRRQVHAPAPRGPEPSPHAVRAPQPSPIRDRQGVGGPVARPSPRRPPVRRIFAAAGFGTHASTFSLGVKHFQIAADSARRRGRPRPHPQCWLGCARPQWVRIRFLRSERPRPLERVGPRHRFNIRVLNTKRSVPVSPSVGDGEKDRAVRVTTLLAQWMRVAFYGVRLTLAFLWRDC